MSADLNRVVLVGNLTRDPEPRPAAEEPVAALRLAVSGRTRSPDGAWVDRSHYFDVTCFGRQAELALAHLARGRRLGVDGRLSWREWTTGGGARRQGVEVIAQELYFLDAPPPEHPALDAEIGAPERPGAPQRAA